MKRLEEVIKSYDPGGGGGGGVAKIYVKSQQCLSQAALECSNLSKCFVIDG